jgi:hypothetical protein
LPPALHDRFLGPRAFTSLVRAAHPPGKAASSPLAVGWWRRRAESFFGKQVQQRIFFAKKAVQTMVLHRIHPPTRGLRGP